MSNWYAEALGSVNQFLEFRYMRQESSAKKKADLAQADLVLDNAKARLAAGTREANFRRHQSRVVQSDASAAMAGQGTGVDIEDLAKIKSRADFNAISALFEAETQSADMRVRGMSMRSDAYNNARSRARAAELGAWGNMFKTGQRASGSGFNQGASN